MRFNKLTDATKILIFSATVIIVCILCAIGFKMVGEGKSAVSNGTNQYNNMAAEYSDINLTTYDGTSVLGSQVVNLIEKIAEKDQELAVKVITKAGTTTSYNRVVSGTAPDYSLSATGASKTVKTDISASDYINPSAQFNGKIYKNTNGIIVIVEFTQQ